MANDGKTDTFAAFRQAVFDDFHLMLQLRQPRERDAYIAEVVAIGAELGYAFDADVVRAAMREGELAWLMQGVDLA